MRRGLLPLLCSLIVLATAACAPKSTPVGSVEVSPADVQLPHSSYTRLTLSWQMTEPLPELQGQLRVLLHLLDGAGEVVRTFDHSFPEGWKVGEDRSYEVEIYQSALGPALEPGEYALTTGLYDEAGNRWALEAKGEAVDDGEYRAAAVTTLDTGVDSPEFYFSETWLPIEGGTDRQILGRRWLTGDGVLRLGRIQAPGTMWLRIGVPAGTGQRQELVLAEGAVEPAAKVTSTCGEFSLEVAGAGGHNVEIPIVADAEGALPEECEIALSANFQLVSLENQERRTIALEGLAWSGS